MLMYVVDVFLFCFFVFPYRRALVNCDHCHCVSVIGQRRKIIMQFVSFNYWDYLWMSRNVVRIIPTYICCTELKFGMKPNSRKQNLKKSKALDAHSSYLFNLNQNLRNYSFLLRQTYIKTNLLAPHKWLKF